MHPLVALVTLLSLVLFLWMGARVSQARTRYNAPAPAMSGPPEFERAFRIQANTLEGLIVFLPSLWIFTVYSHADYVAAGIGAVWLVGRVVYALGYARAAQARGPGFAIQGLAQIALLLCALGYVVWHVVKSGVAG